MAPVLGSRTTAVQALRGADLTGKTAVVTGAICAVTRCTGGRILQ